MLLNVSFGIFAFMPKGWVFMAFVILIECFLLSKFLTHKWWDRQICGTVTLSNIISGIIGIIISIMLNGGWWLVLWLPWVSSNEVPNLDEGLPWLTVYYLCAFILTLIIESMVNLLFLKKKYEAKHILKATFWANVISYLIGSIVLYSFSFGLL